MYFEHVVSLLAMNSLSKTQKTSSRIFNGQNGLKQHDIKKKSKCVLCMGSYCSRWELSGTTNDCRYLVWHCWPPNSWSIALLRTQNSENYLFNPNITFCISFNKYIKLINSFVLGRHLLRQDIVALTDATLGCLKQNSFIMHIIRYVYNFMFGYWAKRFFFK